MNVELETLPNCQAILKIEVESDRVQKERDRVTNEFRSFAKVPGFRPGKAPQHIITQRFKKDIQEELTRVLLSDTTREAIREKSLKALSVANVEDIEFGADQTFRYKATLVISPEFELPDYKAIQVAEPPTEVTEEEVAETLERLRQQYAEYPVVTDRTPTIDANTLAIVDYKGTIDGKPVSEVTESAGWMFDGGKEVWIEMEPKDKFFIPGFAEQLVGLKIGDSKEFDITLPDDFRTEALQGKTVHFAVTLKELREEKQPELNDEFAKKIQPEKTLEELKEMIRDTVGANKKEKAERQKRDAFIKELLGLVSFELPETMVHREMRHILETIVNENQSRGISEDLLEENKEKLVQTATDEARDRVKSKFILIEIAKKENIRVTEAEQVSYLIELARYYDIKPEKLVKDIRKNNAMDKIVEDVLINKVLDFLITGDSTTEEAEEAKPAESPEAPEVSA